MVRFLVPQSEGVMASIKKRVLNNGKDVRWDAIWNVPGGNKRSRIKKTFNTKKEAQEYLDATNLTQPSISASFVALKDHYLGYYQNLVEAKKRERSSLKQIEEHFRKHVLTDNVFAQLTCREMNTVEVQNYLDRLAPKVSSAMAKKVRTTLSLVFSYGVRRGFMLVNPVEDTKLDECSRPEISEDVNLQVPEKESLGRLLAAARIFDNTGRTEALVRLGMYAGLRASEARGLPWDDLDIDGGSKVTINQKADTFNKVGKVKSKCSKRRIGLGAETVDALKKWRDAAPAGKFVFSNEEGKPWSYSNFWNRVWVPLMNRAGLVTNEPASKVVRGWSEAQKDFKQPLFGFHMLRHVYASFQIEQGVSPKLLQKLMGHSTFKLTMDTYGHLWPDDKADLARANSIEKIALTG